MTDKPIHRGRVTYHGPVSDTDPRYQGGWNFLFGSNFYPDFVKRSITKSGTKSEDTSAPEEKPSKRE